MNRSRLIEDIKTNSSVEQSVQRKPYSFCELSYEHNELAYSGIGFSKVCYPDKWNVELGSNKAYYRAISDLYQQVVAAQ